MRNAAAARKDWLAQVVLGRSAGALEATAVVVASLARHLAEGGDAQAVLRSASTGAERPS